VGWPTRQPLVSSAHRHHRLRSASDAAPFDELVVSNIDGVPVRVRDIGHSEDGTKELRQLDFWVGPVPEDPLDDWKVKLALLRLDDWLGRDPVRVSWTDVLHGVRKEREVDATERDALRDAVRQRIEHVVDRTQPPDPQPGTNCPQCNHRKGCPVFPNAKRVGLRRRGDTLPGVLSLTPSSVEGFERCPRL